jgi:hypothetical protein
MSSTGFPTLTIDVGARRGDRLVAAAVLLLVVAAILQLERRPSTIALVLLCAIVSIAGTFLMIGWIAGKRRVARIVCQSDGRWLLGEAGGRTSERELSGVSRVSAHAIWLQWQGELMRPLLLLPGDIPEADFRRLVVRLRLMPMAERVQSHES